VMAGTMIREATIIEANESTYPFTARQLLPLTVLPINDYD
jgi:hypothetical protein